MIKSLLFYLLSGCSIALAAPAVLFEEVEVKDVSEGHQSSKKRLPESEITPLSQRSSLKRIYDEQEFLSTDDLRAHRRVGIGALTSGATGLLGAIIELNLTLPTSALIGFGGGPGYRAFNFQWKHNFGGQSFSPYAGIGYARWYNASGSESVEETTPSILESKFLSDAQKRSGVFGIDLLTPTAGLQYNFLSGENKGLGLFGEIVLLTEIENISPAPVGAFGALYYF